MKIAIVAGEASGDALGARLMESLRRRAGADIAFVGVGGDAMEAAGLVSFFPMADIAVMGFTAVIGRLPTLLRRIRETAERIVAERPDGLVIVDSPDFTHRVARKVRARMPGLPVVDYVSPTVWAWRPGRARVMRGYVDRVLALLPFEPEAHRRLGGPRCDYVGHPLIERLDELRPGADEAARREAQPPIVAVLPGSRRMEVERLMPAFGEALALVQARVGALDVRLPTLPHVEPRVRALARDWPTPPKVTVTEAEKLALYRSARVALAASGTATLELALAGVPLVGAYRVSPVEALLRYVIVAPFALLPNLILGREAIPELLQERCTPEALAGALAALIESGAARQAQMEALGELDASMRLPDGAAPSEAAADSVLDVLRAPRS